MRISLFKSSFFKLPEHRQFEYISRTESSEEAEEKSTHTLKRGFIQANKKQHPNSSIQMIRLAIIVGILTVPALLYFMNQTLAAILALIVLFWLLFRSIKNANA